MHRSSVRPGGPIRLKNGLVRTGTLLVICWAAGCASADDHLEPTWDGLFLSSSNARVPSEDPVAVFLAAGEADRAVAWLSARGRPARWAELNDTAVALWVRGTESERPQDRLAALEGFVEARAEAARLRSHAPSSWNVASLNLISAMTRLGLTRSAREEHAEATDSDTHRRVGPALQDDGPSRFLAPVPAFGPSTGREAIERAVHVAPRSSRDWCEGEGIDRWLDGDEFPARICGWAGEIFRRERSTSEIERIWTELTQCSDPCREAVQNLRTAVSALEAGDIEAAQRALRHCDEDDLPPSLEPHASYYGLVLSRSGVAGEQLERARLAANTVDASRSPGIAGRLEWRRGIALGIVGRHTEAMKSFEEGSRLVEATAGAAAAGFGRILMAEEANDIGNLDEAWRWRLQALTDLAQDGHPRHVYTVLADATAAAGRETRPVLAQLFARELEIHIQATGSDLLAMYGQLILAETASYLRQPRQALDHLHGFQSAASRVSSQGRSDLSSLTSVIEARAVAEGDPERAIGQLESAVQSFRSREDLHELLPAIAELGGLWARNGRLSRAKSAFQEALVIADQQRRAAGPGDRLFAFDRIQYLADDLVTALADSGAHWDAVVAAEQVRARSLHDLAGLSATVQLRPTSIPPRTVVLYSHSTPVLVHTWLMDSSGVLGHLVHEAESARALLSRIERAVRREDAEWRDLAAEFCVEWEGICRIPFGGSYDRLVFVPDGPMWRLPIGILPADGRTSSLHARFLTDIAVVSAPSLSLFLRPSSHRSTSGSAAFGPADLGGTKFDYLRPLPGAEEQITQIVALAPDASAFRGRSVTSHALRNALQEKSLVHYAGHALVVADDPRRSRIPLAGAANAALSVADLADAGVHSATVILAACETAEGGAFNRASQASLASTMMALGAGSVLGTRWPVEDRAASEVILSIHRKLGEGPSLARAVQLAAREGLRSAAPNVRVWANLVVFEHADILSLSRKGEADAATL